MNTVLTYAIYLLMLSFLPYGAAYTIAFVFGVGIAYALQSRFVFGAQPSLRGLVTFPIVYVAQYLLGALVLATLVESGLVNRELALLAVLAVTVPLGFVASRAVFAFHRRHGDTRR